MKKAIAKMSVWLVGPWSRLGPRDRRMLVLLAAVLLAVLLWQGLWQPAQVRLAGAERQFQQHWELAREISTASPQSSRASASVGPAQVSETVAAAGLELEQLNVDATDLGTGLDVHDTAVALYRNSGFTRPIARDSAGNRFRSAIINMYIRSGNGMGVTGWNYK